MAVCCGLLWLLVVICILVCWLVGSGCFVGFLVAGLGFMWVSLGCVCLRCLGWFGGFDCVLVGLVGCRWFMWIFYVV